MADVRSSWKLTWDPEGTPVVLLDIGDRVASEILWPSERGAEVVPLPDADVPFLRDSGNQAIRISYDRIEQGTGSHASVCKAIMARLIQHGTLAKKPVKIEAAGVADVHWMAEAALAPRMEPGIRVSGRSEYATRYTLILAGIEAVDTEEDPLALPENNPADPGSLI